MAMIAIEIASPVEQVELHVGEELLIRMEENATTGYIWRQATALPKEIEAKGDRTVPGVDMGAAGTHEFKYFCQFPVSARVRFELSRPWQPDQPIRTSDVNITCRQKP